MKISDECNENERCSDCKDYQALKGFEICQHYQCAGVSSDKGDVREKCEKVVVALNELLEKNGRHLNGIIEDVNDNKPLSVVEKKCYDTCLAYIFDIRPTLQNWIETQTRLPECGKCLYKLIFIEDEIKKSLDNLAESM